MTYRDWWFRWPFEPDSPWPRLLVASVAVVVVAAWTTFAALRLTVTYRLEVELLLLKSEVAQLVRDHDAIHTRQQDQLDELERTMYGDVLPRTERTEAKQQQQRPLRAPPLELWQRSLNEIRSRVTTIERRLFLESPKRNFDQ